MSNPLLEVIKQAAVEAMRAQNPVKVAFGTVISGEPNLQIKISDKLILTSEFLILTRNVTDFNVDMTVDHITEDADPKQTDQWGGGAWMAAVTSHTHRYSHKHKYKGRKTFLVHNKLLAGEQVLLFAIQGGQKYIVVDRVV